jgi:hypothetical protein
VKINAVETHVEKEMPKVGDLPNINSKELDKLKKKFDKNVIAV